MADAQAPETNRHPESDSPERSESEHPKPDLRMLAAVGLFRGPGNGGECLERRRLAQGKEPGFNTLWAAAVLDEKRFFGHALLGYAALGLTFALNNVVMCRRVVIGSGLQGMALIVPISGLSFLIMAIGGRSQRWPWPFRRMWKQRHPKRDALVVVPNPPVTVGQRWAEFQINASTSKSYGTRCDGRSAWAGGMTQAVAATCTRVGYALRLPTHRDPLLANGSVG
jgi:hypothetical protein